jgi:hypothetical protein
VTHSEPAKPPIGIRTRPRKAIVLAAVLDVAFVVIFAATGRASHSVNVLGGLWSTSWTFLAALAIGWIAARAWRRPMAPVRTGVSVWAITVAGGMLLRWASGQGVQFAFVVVAAAVLLLTLVGWRLLATLVLRRRPAR